MNFFVLGPDPSNPAVVAGKSGRSDMFIVKWKCRFNDLGGQFPPTSNNVARGMVKSLTQYYPDYEYWIEQERELA